MKNHSKLLYLNYFQVRVQVRVPQNFEFRVQVRVRVRKKIEFFRVRVRSLGMNYDIIENINIIKIRKNKS